MVGLSAREGGVTVTYVDDEKVASSKKATAAAAAAAATASEKEKTGNSSHSAAAAALKQAAEGLRPAVKQISLASSDDMFANMVFASGGSGSATSGGGGMTSISSSSLPQSSSSIVPTPTAAASLSISDAFGELAEMYVTGVEGGEGGGGTESTPPSSARDNTTIPAKKSPPPKASSTSTNAVHPMLVSLSPNDLTSFMSAGGSAGDLSQITLSGISRNGEKGDALYFILQLLRQTGSRPHVRVFDFPLSGTSLGKEAAKGGAGDEERETRLSLHPPDFFTWLTERAKESGAPLPEKPAILCQTRDISAMKSFIEKKEGGGAGGALLDLFA